MRIKDTYRATRRNAIKDRRAEELKRRRAKRQQELEDALIANAERFLDAMAK